MARTDRRTWCLEDVRAWSGLSSASLSQSSLLSLVWRHTSLLTRLLQDGGALQLLRSDIVDHSTLFSHTLLTMYIVITVLYVVEHVHCFHSTLLTIVHCCHSTLFTIYNVEVRCGRCRPTLLTIYIVDDVHYWRWTLSSKYVDDDVHCCQSTVRCSPCLLLSKVCYYHNIIKLHIVLGIKWLYYRRT